MSPLHLDDPATTNTLLGLCGLVLAVFGARLEPIVVVAPGAALGAWAAHTLVPDGAPHIRLVTGIALGLTLAVVSKLAHALAVRILGAAALVCAPVMLGLEVPPSPLWLGLLGLLGALAGPSIARQLLRVTTPLAGAALICMALQWRSPGPLIAITLLGIAAQLTWTGEQARAR